MNPVKFHRLELHTFRGATIPAQIVFDPEKNLTMIFGQNGAGKSSIVDAFSFLCEGKFGSLEDRSGTESDYIAAITGNRKDLRVKLVTGGGTWEAVLKGKTNVEVTPPSGAPSARILRRAQILQLIEQKPTDRYKALGQYIELPGVSKCEATLREAEKDSKGAYERAVAAQSQASVALNDLWNREGKPGTSAEQWAETEKGRDLTQTTANLDEVKTLLGAIGQLISAHDDWQKKQEAETGAAKEENEADEALKNEEAKNSSADRNVYDLLKRAQTFIDASDELNTCPVCRQIVDREKLRTDLATLIAEMDTLGRFADAAQQAARKLSTAKTLCSNSLKAYLPHLQSCATLVKKSGLGAVERTAFTQDLLDTLISEETPTETRLTTATEFISKLPPLQASLQADQTAWQTRLSQHNAISSHYDTLVRMEKESIVTEELWKRTKQALGLVVEKRKEFVAGELASISAEVERLYRFIHPDEKLGQISLGLDPKTQGSLHLKGKFYTETDVTPQSLFSESHLDTLGFCVFFALAKKYRGHNSIVALDDVVTSVDDAHLSRFIDLLHEEAKHFTHILITTHYRPWRERYRLHRAPGGNMHFIDLLPWSLERGIRAHNTKLSIAELRDALNGSTFNRRDIANQAGILVENVLDFLTVKYACRLPRKMDSAYTLRELTDAFPKELLKVLRVETVGVTVNPDKTKTFQVASLKELKPLIDKFKELGCVRNQVGCHYNYDGASVSDADIEEFGKAALEFGTLMTCPAEGEMPTRDKSGSYWETRSGEVRLYPLATPKN